MSKEFCGLELNDSLDEKLKKAKSAAVEGCIEEEEKIKNLIKQIDDCDGVLENFEATLSSFLNELGTISSDMRRLKEQSVVINQQLHNRQRVRGELSQFVDDMVISTSMIKTILEKDVGSIEFLEQLHELQHKLNFVKAQQFQDAKSVEDVQDVVENLKYKAMEKIRTWLLLKIEIFKKPFTNYQVTQTALLKNRFFYEFLLANDRTVASEIKEEYVDIVGKMYFSYFKEYISMLFKLQMIDSATKTDLLGAEDLSIRPLYGALNLPNLFSTKTATQSRSKATVFSLGNRLNILGEELLAPLIVPNIARESHETFQFESLFRSIQFAVVDHCSFEYLFICDFFIANQQLALDLFNKIMGRSIGYLTKILEEKISSNHDSISIYMCVCLCRRYLELMKEREIPAIESYFESLCVSLWSRFEWVMNLHTDSLRTHGKKSAQCQGPDTRPYYVVRKYAELTTSLLSCSHVNYKENDNRLIAILSKHQSEIENLINRMASQLRTRKEQLIFQINNYDLVLSVLNEKISFETKEKLFFDDLLKIKISAFVEELIKSYFLPIVQFLSEYEELIVQDQSQLLSKYSGKISQIVSFFNNNWKRSTGLIRGETQSFTNFKNGSNILSQVIEHLYQLHKRLYKVTTSQSIQINENLVDQNTINDVLKSYQISF